MLSTRRIRQIDPRKLQCPCTAPFSIHTGQAGCYKAKVRYAAWLNIRSMHFYCCQEWLIFIDLEKGCLQPSSAGFSMRARICANGSTTAPPPAQIKTSKGGKYGQKTLKCRCGYEGDPKNILSYKPGFFLATPQKSYFCTKNPII